jgi:quercetin dioxygenase-like cupin family protein
MPLPQDIRPAFQSIQDTLVRATDPWIEQSPTAKMKVLWVSPESSTWAVLIHWKKGHVARPHKHLGGAHAFVVSGKLQVRDGVLNAGDYVYEPSGVLHDSTTALEDTTYMFICDGSVLYFDDNTFTGYTNWETIAQLRDKAAMAKAAE